MDTDAPSHYSQSQTREDCHRECDELSSRDPYPEDYPQVESARPECSPSSAVLVTPIPLRVKSQNNDHKSFSVAPFGKVKSKGLGDTYNVDDCYRFSQEDGASEEKIKYLKEETNNDSRFSEIDYKAETDDGSRFSETDCKAETDEGSRFSGIDYKVETDEGSRFSEIDYKAETDSNSGLSEANHKAETEEDSRFSDAHGNPDESESEEASLDNVAQEKCHNHPDCLASKDTDLIKEEPTFYELQKREAKNSRKYGDRLLLARQSKPVYQKDDDGEIITDEGTGAPIKLKVGMMKLGGGNQSSKLYPKDPVERSARMDGRYCIAYNCRWNFGAPKYAGQPSGHVSFVPWEYTHDGYDPETIPVSVFVMRIKGQSTLGWEYCGEYVRMNDMKMTTVAHYVSADDKGFILQDIKRSLERENGEWIWGINRWRDKIKEECERDPSPAGPTRLIRLKNKEPEPDDEGREREERLDRESRERATDAAKARALGLDDENLSDIKFAEKLVHYDSFYGSYSIKFVRYDEEMYDFVKDGPTTKNKQNKKRQENEQCAKASDWYDTMDQQLEGDHKKMQKKRKRNGKGQSGGGK